VRLEVKPGNQATTVQRDLHIERTLFKLGWNNHRFTDRLRLAELLDFSHLLRRPLERAFKSMAKTNPDRRDGCSAGRWNRLGGIRIARLVEAEQRWNDAVENKKEPNSSGDERIQADSRPVPLTQRQMQRIEC
jgi:hypothetical protein